MTFRGGNKGFTTIEILVSMVVFAVAMVGLTTLLTTTMRANALAARLTIATTLAQGQVEEIRSTAFSNVEAGSKTVSGSGDPTSQSTTEDVYQVKWTVEEGYSGTKEVTVTVDWGTGEHHVELKTLVFG